MHKEATLGSGRLSHAPDWTRTSTSYWTQALNLPCMPIPPRGRLRSIVVRDGGFVNLGLPRLE